MPRNSAKAIVLHEGRILVNRCVSRFGTYYALPGGGQKHGETLTEAVQRELLEEAGLSVRPMRLSAIYETISNNRPEGLNHKLYFIFLCSLNDVRPVEPSNRDTFQTGTEWVPLSEIQKIHLFPRAVRDNIMELIGYGETLYLGSEKKN